MEKFERPLPGHSVAVLVNGDIPEDTLKSYAQTFADNKFNYAFVGTKAKNIDEDFGVTETFDTAHPTLFDSLIVLSDGETLEDPSKEFAQLSFKHKKPLVFNQQAANLFENLDLDLNAPGVKVSDEPDAIVDAFQKVRYWER